MNRIRAFSAVSPRPLIFISAVSRELHSARQLVANTLTFLGYQPVWQDVFGTEGGDLRELLRQQIDHCKGLVQLVGECYGAEPPTVDEEFGRVSYTQYETLHARKRGKKVWYLFIDARFPKDACDDEPTELRQLQANYRRRLQSDTHLFHPLISSEALEASVLKLRSELSRLRRGVIQWAIGVTGLLLLIIGLIIWLQSGQQQTAQGVGETKKDIAVLKELIRGGFVRLEAQARASQNETGPSGLQQAALQEEIYNTIGREFGVDPKMVREKLPQFAAELKRAPNASSYERASASYVAVSLVPEQTASLAKDYLETERLALGAAREAQKTKPINPKYLLQALELAGLSAQKGIRYDRAMQHFREAEKLTDRDRDLGEWASVQHDIADLLVVDAKYREAEQTLRSVIEARTRLLGPEHRDTLDSRHRLIYPLARQAKYAEAETEARQVLKLREKVLGPEDADTLVSRYNLAETLIGQGKYAEAEALYREVIRLDEKRLGPEDPRTIAARDGLASVLGEEGKNVEAEPLYREVIKLDVKVYGPEHPNTLNDRMSLATVLQALDKYPEAEAQYRDVIKLDEKMVGARHADTLTCRNNLAELLCDEGKYAEAEGECRQIISLEEKAYGPDDQVTLNTRGNLAVALIGQGKFAHAEAQYKEVLRLMERVLGLEHPCTLNYTEKFARGLSRQNKTAEAIEIAAGAEERARKALGPDNPSTYKYAKLAQDLKAPK